MGFDGPLTDTRRLQSRSGETQGPPKQRRYGTQWVKRLGPKPREREAPLSVMILPQVPRILEPVTAEAGHISTTAVAASVLICGLQVSGAAG
jgi:hypothetical protein